ncbi:protein sel-1 homolog 3 isoform X1 [Anguilla anguilla]|uniref:protein sel-1 homolog 3 isoform X1 n=1 Tax=Anguilla anguilla TaxID=7936 RepID=UPI0015B25FEB|nr:protein sel-1 homolog 3 isoform X1 [Anguilla anguilla]
MIRFVFNIMKNQILEWCMFLLIYHTLLTLSYARSESLYQNGFDEVTFLNPPTEPVSAHHLHVRYSCSESAVVYLDALVSSDAEAAKSVFERQWSCEPGPARVRSLILRLPDWLVYRADWKIPDSEWVLGGMLRAWIVGSGSPNEYGVATTRSLVLLQPLNPYSRPLKQHQLCPSWDTEMLWRIRKDSIPRCPAEQEVAHFLSVLYASTGENFGITRTLSRYGNEVLEHLRVKAVFSPWCVFSAWLFLTQPCRHRLCGVLHHINSQNVYASPSVFLTSSGQLHVQVYEVSGVSTAFLSHFQLPVQQWCRITLELLGRAANVSAVCVGGQGNSGWSAYHTFSEPVLLDDTDGYFVLGGGQFVRGVEGFHGPTVYYRNRVPLLTEKDEVSILQADLAVNMTGWFHSCQEFKLELDSKLTGHLLRIQEQEQARSCVDVFSDWVSRATLSATPPQCELWEGPAIPRRRHAARLARMSLTRHGGRRGQLTWVGGALYSAALRRLTRGGGLETVSRVMPLLLQSACLGDGRALYLSSVLYGTGLGVRRRTNKARLLSLLAAQQDWRLALLRLGHLHHLGDRGVPADPALAYAYYANIASQTARDTQTPSPEQTFVELIYLNNEEMLKRQTSKDGDLFLWLKLQARNGAAEAEQAVARMLFWGQQGVSPDIQTAVKHYERGATRLEDPTSMYNYAIVLLQGQGVEKDIPKAVKYLKKAVDQSFVPAITALGWYFEQYERDYARAVALWDRADALGCGEAAVNLGTLHSQGLYPGQPASQYMAYTYYLKSANRGHIVGAIRLAEVWSSGIPGLVKRLPLDAVLWAKWAAEQNGYLGTVLRKAVDAYFRRDWLMALVYYLMAAEAGFAAAQFNVAYLCEHNPGGLLDPVFVTECMWRYYNLSTQSQDTPPYALIRMGDLIYGSAGRSRRDVSSVAELYKQAVLKNDPQGWYSLGLLVQEGHVLPGSVLTKLDLRELHGADNLTILTTLYSRCRDHESSEAYFPCCLALFYTQLQSVWKYHANALKVSSAVVIAAVTLLMVGWGRLRGTLSQF